MQILECITEQIADNRVPLVGVTIAAIACPDTPFIVTLHWHGFVKERQADGDPAGRAGLAPIPSTSLQLNEHWTDFVDLDRAAMEAGWELGAWDVVRAQRPACMRPGAEAHEAVECLQAFGSSTHRYRGVELILAEAPDADELIKVAAQAGYLHWQFRPVYGGLWNDAHDATLNRDGTRTPHCPLAPIPRHSDDSMRTVFNTVYKFGEDPDRLPS